MEKSIATEINSYLSFKLGNETFASNVSKVLNILEMMKITQVPKSPAYMKGVINLRGGVVPVIDMRLKFGMPATEQTVDTCIIIVEVEVDDESIVLGALADSVQEVFHLNTENIEPAPKLGTQINTEFLKGMGKKDDEFVLLLEIDKVFNADELELVHSTGHAEIMNMKKRSSL